MRCLRHISIFLVVFQVPLIAFKWRILRRHSGNRVCDRMQKCRLQKRTEIEKQYCIQIDSIYYLSLFSFALFANMKKIEMNIDRKFQKQYWIKIDKGILCMLWHGQRGVRRSVLTLVSIILFPFREKKPVQMDTKNVKMVFFDKWNLDSKF